MCGQAVTHRPRERIVVTEKNILSEETVHYKAKAMCILYKLVMCLSTNGERA